MHAIVNLFGHLKGIVKNLSIDVAYFTSESK